VSNGNLPPRLNLHGAADDRAAIDRTGSVYTPQQDIRRESDGSFDRHPCGRNTARRRAGSPRALVKQSFPAVGKALGAIAPSAVLYLAASFLIVAAPAQRLACDNCIAAFAADPESADLERDEDYLEDGTSI
jgi:hypothetical protein